MTTNPCVRSNGPRGPAAPTPGPARAESEHCRGSSRRSRSAQRCGFVIACSRHSLPERHLFIHFAVLVSHPSGAEPLSCPPLSAIGQPLPCAIALRKLRDHPRKRVRIITFEVEGIVVPQLAENRQVIKDPRTT